MPKEGYDEAFMEQDLVEVPIKDLTNEQLLKHVERLHGELRGYRAKTDQQVREENKRLWKEAYATGGQLEAICDTLLYYGLGGYTHTSKETLDKATGKDKGYISAGIRKLARMTDAEKEAALARHKS